MDWWLVFIALAVLAFIALLLIFGVIDEIFCLYDINFKVVYIILIVLPIIISIIATNSIFAGARRYNQAKLERGDVCVLETRPLKAIDMNLETQGRISGSYFLFYGSVHGSTSEELYYYMYAKLNEGYKLYKIPMSYVEIVETDDIEPSIKAEYNTYKNKYCIQVENGYRSVVVYIPSGSIVPTYDLDVNNIGGVINND